LKTALTHSSVELFMGAIYIYRILGDNTWVSAGRVDAPVQDYTSFGCSVSVSDNNILVGANSFGESLCKVVKLHDSDINVDGSN
jgi:hypothetical protein